jgi:hypothetical protein
MYGGPRGAAIDYPILIVTFALVEQLELALHGLASVSTKSTK